MQHYPVTPRCGASPNAPHDWPSGPERALRPPPSIQRLLQRVDPDALDQALAAWAATRATGKVIAIDGKELRSAKRGGHDRVHLMSALDHDTGAVLAQIDVHAKTNEVRREVPCYIPHLVRMNSEGGSWTHRLTRMPKGEGDQSMPVQTWWPCPHVGMACQGSPPDRANAGLRESQSPVMQVFIHRKLTCVTGAALCVGLFRWPAQLPQRGAMPSEGIQGDEWGAYVRLLRIAGRKHGIAYGMRILWRRSARSSHRSHDRSRRAGRPSTGRRGTGSSDITITGGMRNAEC